MKSFSEYKAKIKKHAPELIVAALTVAGSAGWIVAGVYAQRLKDLETVDPNAWPTIEISPGCMRDVKNGATVKYRQKRGPGNHIYSQSTTLDDFPEEENQRFENEPSNQVGDTSWAGSFT